MKRIPKSIIATGFFKWGTTRAMSTTTVMTPCSLLSPQEQAVAESIRTFSLKEVKPRVRQMDEEAKMDRDLLKELFQNGLMGIETPAELGGSGMSHFMAMLIIEELGRHCGAVSLTVDLQSMLSAIFYDYGTEEQKRTYLPRLATEACGCFCLTEPHSGSDAFALRTQAQKDGNNYIINGTKIFISNAAFGEIFLVMANVDPSKGYKGVTCFIVDKKQMEGVNIGRKENKMGLRASETCEVNFNNVCVPSENIIGGLGTGYKVAIECLNAGRIGIAAQMVGIAQGALDHVMPYLFERKQFGKYIGDFQGMQFQYAQALTELHAARLMVYNASRKKDHHLPIVEDGAMAKLYASQVADSITSRCVEWMGGVGYTQEYGVEKYFRDSKIGSIYEGTSNIQLQTIAKLAKEKYQK